MADKNTLSVVDNRTGKSYTVAISGNNSVDATAFKAMKAKTPAGGREEDEVEGGLRVFDPGFMNTAIVKSTITYIDGEKGILRYRGVPIEQVAERSSFLETSYLLLYGSLPTRDQLNYFTTEVMHHSSLHADVDKVLSAFRYDAHPMAILTSSFAALGSLSPDASPSLAGQNIFTNAGKGDLGALKIMDKQIYRLIGKAISLGAGAYRVRQGRPLNRLPPGLSYSESFLYLLDYYSERDYRPNPVFVKALDVLFILHVRAHLCTILTCQPLSFVQADHELNCSTATVMQVGSALTDPYSCVAAGCAALFGPSHGGANEAVIRMLMKIGSPKNVPAFVEKVKRKEVVLSGFGHRVYRNVDPRSKVIRKIAEDVFAVTGRNELLDTAIALHDHALKDEYFTSRKLYPNVDFWSGLIYQQMGFPVDFFVVLFAIPRVVGWLAHWRQMMLQASGVKIFRPRQLYVGEAERPYISIRDREDGSGGDPKKAPSRVPHPSSIRALYASHRDSGRSSHL